MIEFEIKKGNILGRNDCHTAYYYLSLEVPELKGYSKLYLSQGSTLTNKLSECLKLESFEDAYFKAMSIRKFVDLALKEFFKSVDILRYDGIIASSVIYDAVNKAITSFKIDEDYFDTINIKFSRSVALKKIINVYNVEIQKAIDEAESPKKSEVIDGFPYVIFNNKLNEYVRTPHSTTKDVNMAARFASTDKAYDFIHLNMPFNEYDFEIFIPKMEPTPQEEAEAKASDKNISQETVKENDQPEDVGFIAYFIDCNGEIHQIKVDSNNPKFEWNEVNLNDLVLRKCNTPQKEETEAIDWEKIKSQLEKRYFNGNLYKSFQKEEEEENDEKGPHEWTELFRAILNDIPLQ